MHISEQKSALRLATKERLERMTPEERAAESRSLCRRLLPLIPIGSNVCAYMPLKTEPDLRPLIRELLARGEAVYLPVFANSTLVFRRVYDLSTLAPGTLNIPEPPAENEELGVENADVVLVPGRAFDASGNRLGRGAGGYDQWIRTARTGNRQPRMIGVAYECQIERTVPTEPHDQKMDAVVTARGPIGE